MPDTQTKLKRIIYAGLKDASKTSLGIFKIMLPLSLLMAILNYLGVIKVLSTFLQPAASLLGLRGQGIPVLLSGYLINTYSAIALMISLDLSLKELSVLSAMILLAHPLPVELSIQKKASGNVRLLFLIRVGAGILITAKENQALEKEEIRKLNVSICSMHSVIQETANFLPFGGNIFILIIPILITSIVSVWVYNIINICSHSLNSLIK